MQHVWRGEVKALGQRCSCLVALVSDVSKAFWDIHLCFLVWTADGFMGRTSCNVARSVQVSSTLMLPLPLDRASISFASSFETASGRNCVSYDRAGLMNLQGPLPFLNFHNIRVHCKVFDNVVDFLMHHPMHI